MRLQMSVAITVYPKSQLVQIVTNKATILLAFVGYLIALVGVFNLLYSLWERDPLDKDKRRQNQKSCRKKICNQNNRRFNQWDKRASILLQTWTILSSLYWAFLNRQREHRVPASTLVEIACFPADNDLLPVLNSTPSVVGSDIIHFSVTAMLTDINWLNFWVYLKSEIMIDGFNVRESHPPYLDIRSGKFRPMFLPVIKAGQHSMSIS